MSFNYMTTKQAAEKWCVSERRIQQYCESGHLDGVIRPGREWLIPIDTPKPIDKRFNSSKKDKTGFK